MTITRMIQLILEAIGLATVLSVATYAVLRPLMREMDTLMKFEDEHKEAHE